MEGAGHAAIDVRDIGLGDADDASIATRANADGLCLLTGDFSFADVRNDPPAEYVGLVVFEFPKGATANVILSLVKAFLSRDEVLVKLPGRLGIVAFEGIRLRPK